MLGLHDTESAANFIIRSDSIKNVVVPYVSNEASAAILHPYRVLSICVYVRVLGCMHTGMGPCVRTRMRKENDLGELGESQMPEGPACAAAAGSGSQGRVGDLRRNGFPNYIYSQFSV